MPALIRMRALNGFEATVSQLGGDPAPLLASVGLRPADLQDPNRWMTLRGHLRLLELASRRLREPAFGVALARARELAYLGPLLLMAQHSETVGAALHNISRYIGFQNTSHRTAFDIGPRTCVRTFEMPRDLRRLGDQFVEASLVSTQRLVSHLIGEDAPVLWYSVRHPPLRAAERYASELGVPIRFEQDLDAVVFERSVAGRAIPNRDPNMKQFVMDYLDERFIPAEHEVVSATRNLIEALIPSGRANVETVAERLALHPRTLQRRLTEHGLSFSRLLEEQRKAMAERLLKEGNLPLGNVAGFLGYAEQSAFNHAFERWHGTAPSRWAGRAS